MAAKTTTVRFNREDEKLFQRLKEHLGIDTDADGFRLLLHSTYRLYFGQQRDEMIQRLNRLEQALKENQEVLRNENRQLKQGIAALEERIGKKLSQIFQGLLETLLQVVMVNQGRDIDQDFRRSIRDRIVKSYNKIFDQLRF